MKKLLLIAAFTLSLTSCVAQDLKMDPPTPLIADFLVSTICDGQATIENGGRRWLVEDKGLQEGKEYLMKIIQTDCNKCFKRKAELISFEFSTKQIQKNHREMVQGQ